MEIRLLMIQFLEFYKWEFSWYPYTFGNGNSFGNGDTFTNESLVGNGKYILTEFPMVMIIYLSTKICLLMVMEMFLQTENPLVNGRFYTSPLALVVINGNSIDDERLIPT